MQTPRAPAVAPARVAPAVPAAPAAPAGATAKPPGGGRWEDEPPSGGWDAADTVTSFPEPSELPAPTPRNLPATATASAALEKAAVPVAAAPAPVAAPPTAAPATPASPVGASAPGTMRARYETSPGVGGPPVALSAAGSPAATRGITAPSAASQAGLGNAMREEVWSIVRAAVEEAMGPLVARQRELEARVERAERETDADRTRAARALSAPSTAPQGGGSGIPKLALGAAAAASSIPVALGPSLSPPALNIPANSAVPDFKLSPHESPARTAADDRPREKTSAHPVGPRPSIPVNGYGVTVMTVPRATLDLESVGPVDIDGFDGGKSKKRVATFVVVIMLLLIVGAVTMTILSHN